MKKEDKKTSQAQTQENEQTQSSAKQAQHTAAEAQSSESAKQESTADQMAAAQKEIEKLKDQVLRQAAEFDNYRKRTLKEKAELLLNGGEKVIAALLPILDDLKRAQDNIEKSDDVATLKEGVELIINKLHKVLSAQGLKEIEAVGTDFNTDFHEAIALIPATDDSQKGKIVDCTQTGYTLNEKVIRHAKVVVAQ